MSILDDGPIRKAIRNRGPILGQDFGPSRSPSLGFGVNLRLDDPVKTQLTDEAIRNRLFKAVKNEFHFWNVEVFEATRP